MWPSSKEDTIGSYVYVDNLGIVANNASLVKKESENTAAHFNFLGLAIHEMEVSDTLGVALGMAIHTAGLETRSEHQRW